MSGRTVSPGVDVPPDVLVTEGGDPLTTEGGDPLTTEGVTVQSPRTIES